MPRTAPRTPLAHPVADAAACDRYDCGHVARHADRAMRHAGILYRLVMAHGEGILAGVQAEDSTLAALALMRQGAACADVQARYRDPLTGRMVAAAPRREARALTSGQVAVLAALADGSTPREAGARLYLGEETVRSHRRNALAALGCHSLADALAEAVRQGYPVL